MKIRLSDFNENWAKLYQDEADFLRTIFTDEIVRFEHFGSTSIPGLQAKPVIDMMCIVKDIFAAAAGRRRLKATTVAALSLPNISITAGCAACIYREFQIDNFTH